MKPAVRVVLNGKDMTGTWLSVLESLTVTDEAGIKSDTCEVSFDNREGFKAPPIGATLQIWLGYAPTPVYMGKYKVDAWVKCGGAKRLTVSAKAIDFTGGVRAPRMRSFHQKTVKQIVEQIAGDHGLTPVVDAEIGARMIEHIDQQNESDVSFLSRLAKRHGATFKVADGKLLFAEKGSDKAPSGSAKRAIELATPQLTSWEASCGKRGDFKSASAHYMDHATGRRRTVVAGGGSPRHRDKRLYGSRAEAEAAARANLGDMTRGQKTVQIAAPGMPALYAEAKISLKVGDSDVDGTYLAKSVSHTYTGSGYTTFATLETKGAS